jgi:hypothetical protein
LAINITDGKLFYKDNTNTIQVLATKGSAAGTFTNVTITGGTINGTSVGASTPSTGAFTTLSSTGLATLNSLALGLTGYLYGNGAGATTASTTIPTTALSGTITNAQLANSSVTIGTTAISLGSTSLTLAGLTSVAVTQDPTSALQLATKQYVDNSIQGIQSKYEAQVATTANITLSGLQTIDGYTTVAGDYVLVKNQSTAANNGIYVAASGAWSRASFMSTWAQVVGSFTFIQNGTVNASTGWVAIVPETGTIGTTAINFSQFSGAGSYTAGTGLTLSGTQFSITNTAVTAGSYTLGNFTVNAQGQLTAASSTATTGSGNVVLATSPTLVTPNLGTPSALVGTNITGTAAGLSIGGNAATATTATNTTNVATSTGTAATNYLAFVTATSGNNPVTVNSGLTYNGTTNAITGGINGGTF